MWKPILKATALAGTLDIAAAFIQAYLGSHTMPGTVLKYIASGLFGSSAMAGGAGMMIVGLLVHFLIAFACTGIFFVLYPSLRFLKRSHIANALLIALTAWVVTRLLIVPLSHVQSGALTLSKAAMAIGILFLCVGLPVSMAAGRYFGKA